MKPLRWLAENDIRFPLVLIVYFAMHVIVRGMLSSSLTYDEAEQVYLSQGWQIGYNGQPPLYTWLQIPLLTIVGKASFALPLLKNFFLLLTYVCVYFSIARATANRFAGIVASAAMLTMPQIAWESHRDLSHTVAALFAASWLMLAIVNVYKRPTLANYAVIGLATAAGLLFKYNFAIVLVAFIAAALSIEDFRKRILDPRILFSIVIAAVLVGPHFWWAIQNLDTASSKALTQLLPREAMTLGDRVSTGLIRLAGSTFSCCSVTIAVFAIAFRDHWLKWVWKPASTTKPNALVSKELLATTKLVERSMIGIAAVLLMLVMSGNAVETKNHWLQPFLFLLPAYLVLRLTPFGDTRIGDSNRSVVSQIGGARILTTAGIFAASVLTVLVGRTMSASVRGDYSWLNMPFDRVADQVAALPDAPQLIVATNVRFAGNLKAHVGNTPVATIADLKTDSRLQEAVESGIVLLIFESADYTADARLQIGHAPMELQSYETRLPYRYGKESDGHSFRFCQFRKSHKVAMVADANESRPPQVVGPTRSSVHLKR
ncbi:ArnT family glycosyltransferase [Rubripirellula reticaptiva]|uniref:Glycosyltransferase RgtA/B/C/D-like domain-containing protein n=1 Tax=Rubripirellula reticaptiva TaxID=2528013 RepID=A0A5C6EJM9_9BACT|nr:glycosyltransferase family 39 protein [Rubripirellula reticaptiva]TWU47841.1 hypothetical protein Poly59_46830 [Rubripirellula reticaptiva]